MASEGPSARNGTRLGSERSQPANIIEAGGDEMQQILRELRPRRSRRHRFWLAVSYGLELGVPNRINLCTGRRQINNRSGWIRTLKPILST
jgi:hypothetical protein